MKPLPMKRPLLAAALSLLAIPAMASAAAAAPIVIDQSGSGWCMSNGTCNNTDPTMMYSNNAMQGMNDWFSFELPTANHLITTAVLSIYESGSYTPGSYPDDTWSAYDAYNISYAGLIGDGTVLGSTDTGAAETGVGHYVSIVLDAAALTDLYQGSGGMFIFGGSVANQGNIFGYSPGPDFPATLTVTVPEPFSVTILAVGLAGLGLVRRRSHRGGSEI